MGKQSRMKKERRETGAPAGKATRGEPARAGGAPGGESGRSMTFLWIVIGVIVVAAAFVLLAPEDKPKKLPGKWQSFAEVEITGKALPDFTDPASDPAIGKEIPEVTGETFRGKPISIKHDGRPKLIIFLAHWCPHCQKEVPIIQDWVDENGIPDGLDWVSVSTGASEAKPNFPPYSWLHEEGWTPPVMVDNDIGDVAIAYGLQSYPYILFVNADGTVNYRFSGEMDIGDFEKHLKTVASQAPKDEEKKAGDKAADGASGGGTADKG